jgi:hypothetical protein
MVESLIDTMRNLYPCVKLTYFCLHGAHFWKVEDGSIWRERHYIDFLLKIGFSRVADFVLVCA